MPSSNLLLQTSCRCWKEGVRLLLKRLYFKGSCGIDMVSILNGPVWSQGEDLMTHVGPYI